MSGTKPKASQATLQETKPKPEAEEVRPIRQTHPGTERPSPDAEPPPPPAKAKGGRDTYPGNQKAEELPAGKKLEDTSAPRPPRPGRETYAGNQTMEEIQRSGGAAPPKPRPARPTFQGTEKPAEPAAEAGRKRVGRETFAGNQTAEEIHAAAAQSPVARSRPSSPGTAKPAAPPGSDVPAGSLLLCPGCGNTMKLAVAAPVGRTIKCPGCGQPVPVEWPSEEVLERAIQSQAPAAKFAASDWTGEDWQRPAAAPVLDRPPFSEVAAKVPEVIVRPAPRKIPLLAWVGGGVALLGIAALAFVFFGDRAVPDQAWAVFSPPGGVCEVQFPGRPTLQGSGTSGPKRGTTQYYVRRPEMNSTFILTYVNLPGTISPPAFDDIYQAERGQTLAATSGAVQREQDISLSGHFGKELVIAGSDGRLVTQRIYLVEGDQTARIFILEASGRWRNSDQGAPARFFGSLKLPPRSGATSRPESESN